MDSTKPNDQGPGATKSSIDSLRTVEFRTTIRGYHMDDVDEYLERVAVEAESIQEQVRLAQDRVKQATERVSSLEQQLEQARRVQHAQQQERSQDREAPPVPVGADTPQDDTLQRTLLLAQKFVDQTKEEAQAEAHTLISESEARARVIVADAEEHARVVAENAERNLREEVQRLESSRDDLGREVEAITRQLDAERTRIREVLTEMLSFVDKKIQPQRTFSSSRTAPSEKPKDQLPGTSFGMPTGAEGRDAHVDRSAPADRTAPVDRRGDAPADPAVLQRDHTESTGQPTERMPVASLGSDDDVPEEPASGESIRDSGRGARDRLLPGQQREMFAPGLQPNPAKSRAIR